MKSTENSKTLDEWQFELPDLIKTLKPGMRSNGPTLRLCAYKIAEKMINEEGQLPTKENALRMYADNYIQWTREFEGLSPLSNIAVGGEDFEKVIDFMEKQGLLVEATKGGITVDYDEKTQKSVTNAIEETANPKVAKNTVILNLPYASARDQFEAKGIIVPPSTFVLPFRSADGTQKGHLIKVVGLEDSWKLNEGSQLDDQDPLVLEAIKQANENTRNLQYDLQL